jgi:2-polyprenyl-6-methoxyphenol hydroxylase-like FAD-dependent oxidoreductase
MTPGPEDAGAVDTQVLIVGAGPTGLLLAGELTRRGVGNLLIDAHDAPLGWDRATVVHPRSLEIFESLGLVDRFLDQGVKVKGARFHSDGKILGLMDFRSNGSRYGFDIGISEDVTEAVLTADLERQGGGVERATRLVALRLEPERVVATIESGAGTHEVSAAWVVGCDGYHSAARSLAGIDMAAAGTEASWAVFDATLEGWDAEYDVNAGHFEAARPVILTPLPGRRWRVYLQPASETSDLEADAMEVLERYTPGVRINAIENPARFRCHSRVADRFRSGRLLLAGDAAHACSPTEGHGMNTGLQDAFNLGWKLALVCAEASGPALLDSYEPERRPVAARIVESGADAEAGQALKTAAERAERDAGIAMTFGGGDIAAAHSEAVALAELDRSYSDSTLVTGEAPGDGLPPGGLLPDTDPVSPAGEEPRMLHELTHRPEHTVFVIGGPGSHPGDVADALTTVGDAVADSPLVGAVYALGVEAGGRVGRIGQPTIDQLGLGDLTVLAIRPDRFVGHRSDGGPGLRGYLEGLSS